MRVNLTVRPVTRLAVFETRRTSTGRAQGARPSRPAGYARRYTTWIVSMITRPPKFSIAAGLGLLFMAPPTSATEVPVPRPPEVASFRVSADPATGDVLLTW